MKVSSPSSESNKAPILEVLRVAFRRSRAVLEIGSGSGQHAAYLARALEHLSWYPSDLAPAHASIEAWRAEADLDNLRAPLDLNVMVSPWPLAPGSVDAMFSANTAHIMSWPAVEALFAGAGKVMAPGGRFLQYGPFHYNGVHTSPGNTAFDRDLRARGQGMGIRDLNELEPLAARSGLVLAHDHAMPANNRILEWHLTEPLQAT